MTDVIDAVEAATIAVVDMSFKVTTPRLAGHWLGVALNCNSQHVVKYLQLTSHLAIIFFFIFIFTFLTNASL